MKPLRTFIDLFCGIGGFRVAMENEGLECVFSSEIDERACKAYHANFGEWPAGDITKIPASDVPPHDVLCAGFPCQPFSISGNREGLDDHRGNLFFEITRIAEHHKPRLLLLENVKNILSIDDGGVIRAMRQELRRIGYRMEYRTLNASHYGVPQSRVRVYFACVRADVPRALRTPPRTNERIYLDDVLRENPNPNEIEIRHDGKITRPDNRRGLRPLRIGYFGTHERALSQGYRIYSTKGHAITMMAEGGGGLGRLTGLYCVDGTIRNLDNTETKRVMGFPDDYVVAKGRAGRAQLGNAVIPAMVSLVFRNVKRRKPRPDLF